MKRSDIPSLDDLRAFETVARLGSMRAAADELVLTHGAVSRRVAKLSRELGITLVPPDGRGIALTPDGDILARATQQGLSVIGEALSSIRDKEGDAPIVLSCLGPIGFSPSLLARPGKPSTGSCLLRCRSYRDDLSPPPCWKVAGGRS